MDTTATTATAPEQKSTSLKVFISYARANLDFADQLDAALQALDFTTIIDRKGIHGAEKWETRLSDLILEADTVVFVLTPASANSEVCRWEVDEALKLAKRVIPIIWQPLGDAKPHPHLQDLNYIHFYPEPDLPGSGFGQGLARLKSALSVDVNWIREHTRLSETATRWQRDNRPEDLLLRGSQLKAVQNWRDTRPANAPELTRLQNLFLAECETAEDARKNAERQQLDDMKAAQDARAKALEEAQKALEDAKTAQAAREIAQKETVTQARKAARRTTMGLIVASVLALAAGGAGFYAMIQQDLAVRKAEDAGKSEARTRKVTTEAQFTQSGLLAIAAEKLFDLKLGGDAATAMLLALEGVPDTISRDETRQTWKHTPKTRLALVTAISNLRERATLKGHTDVVTSATFSPDGTRILTASSDKTARLWDAQTGIEITQLQGHQAGVNDARFSPNGMLIITISDDRTAHLWDARIGTPLAILRSHENWIACAQFSPDGTRIVTGGGDNTARFWDAQSGVPLMVLKGHEAWVRSARFSPDGKLVLTASDDRTARLWEVRSGDLLFTFQGHNKGLSTARFSSDGERIITASWDGTARIWDAKSGTLLWILEGHEGPIRSARFLSDGEVVLTASEDGTARIWDATTGSEIASLKGHESWIRSARFSPDGSRILTASGDKTARLWDVKTGETIAILEGHDGKVSDARYSPKGMRILTVSGDLSENDNTVRLWDAPAKINVSNQNDNKSIRRGDQVSARRTSLMRMSNKIIPYINPNSLSLQDLVNAAKAGAPRCLTQDQRKTYFLPLAPPLWCVERKLWPYHTKPWQKWLVAKKAGGEPELPKDTP